MDFAEYWPSTTTRMVDSVAVISDGPTKITEFSSIMFTYHHWVKEYVKSKELLRTDPLARVTKPGLRHWKWAGARKCDETYSGQHGSQEDSFLPTRGIRPCRKIVFDIISRRDCRGEDDPKAVTWFEAYLESDGIDHLRRDSDALAAASAEASNPTAKPPYGKTRINYLKWMKSAWQAPGSITRTFNTKRVPDDRTGVATRLNAIVGYNAQNTKLNQHMQVVWRYDESTDELGSTDSGNANHAHGVDIVRNMGIGDSISLHAKASTRANSLTCMNYVASASVTVYWAL